MFQIRSPNSLRSVYLSKTFKPAENAKFHMAQRAVGQLIEISDVSCVSGSRGRPVFSPVSRDHRLTFIQVERAFG